MDNTEFAKIKIGLASPELYLKEFTKFFLKKVSTLRHSAVSILTVASL